MSIIKKKGFLATRFIDSANCSVAARVDELSKGATMFKFSFPVHVEDGSTNRDYHLGHHNYFLLFQKARIAYLKQFGWSEQNISGFRMFIVEANCAYKKEIFHQDELVVKCGVMRFNRKVFTMNFSIAKQGQVCAQGFTKSICVDPDTRKSVLLPKAFIRAINKYEELEKYTDKNE